MSFDALSYESGRNSGTGQLKKAEKQLQQQQMEILNLKKQLAGVVAVKEVLKDALATSVPDHPFVNPRDDNPFLVDAYRQAASFITSADDEV